MKTILTFLVGLVMASLDAVASFALRFLPCAFDATDMNRIQGGTVTLWIYKTVDPLATIVASGYFNDHALLVKNGDVILAVDTNVPTIDVLAVTSADGAAVVTVQNGT